MQGLQKSLRRVVTVAMTCLLAVAIAGCGDDDDEAIVAPTTLNAVLSGTQEVPATTSTASGTAKVEIAADRNTLIVNLTSSGLTNVTASHIHFGKAGINGGIIFPLFTGQGTFPATLTRTLTSADFTPTEGVATFSEALNAILTGNAYINVHTLANPNGEIRGQIGGVLLAATLAGTQEVPATTSTATGGAAVQLNATQSTIFVNLSTAAISNVTASHIHFGKTGANGGIIFPLFSGGGTFPTKLTKTLTSADFVPDPGVATFSDAVNAILSGNTYINVHTQANPGGEIRGQVGPARFTATLTGAQEVPATGSLATGTATVQFDATQTAINVNMVSQGFTSTVTASHIHVGAAGTNGGIMFPLFAGPGQFPSPLTKILTTADFTPVPGSVATYPEAVNAILSRNAYINIHTQANPAGDIRGQLTPQ